ncbi:hypothetical protein FS749_011076 [Ceratobasidium sp. UAMH 11750]|nr:hypothetical protein FS749_011076 [Ceratobasidium sp. UAMH 11750]
MATTDVDMDDNDGPETDQNVTRLANTLSPYHALVFSDAQSGRGMAVGSEVREQLAQYGSGLERTNETQDRRGSVPANATNVAGVGAGTVLLDAVASQATQELSDVAAYSNEANLTHELDNFLGDIPGNPSLGFDSYLVPLFNAIPLSEPLARSAAPLLNDAPFPTTSRTQWMPDFTFGPSSEHIDIQAFLKIVEETFGSALSGEINEHAGDLRPEGVAGWVELQELDAGGKRALVDESSRTYLGL